jgi:hypothetical protein
VVIKLDSKYGLPSGDHTALLSVTPVLGKVDDFLDGM